MVQARIAIALLIFVGACGAPSDGELTHASVWLESQPDTDADWFVLNVTYGGCSGGTLPEEIERVDVDETVDAIVITAWIRLPQSFPTTCPENPVLSHTVELSSPLGERTIEAVANDRVEILWPCTPSQYRRACPEPAQDAA